MFSLHYSRVSAQIETTVHINIWIRLNAAMNGLIFVKTMHTHQ